MSGSDPSVPIARADAVALGQSRWSLDPAHSSVTFTHRTLWGLATVRGAFTDVTGEGRIDSTGSATGTLRIAAASIDTGHARRDTHLREKGFFAAEEHPEIVFTGTRTEIATDGRTVSITGRLSLRGRVQPLELSAALDWETDERVVLSSATEVDRAAFGLTSNQLGMIKGSARVSVVAAFVRQ
ncbi:YceI family protein [Streptomyces sp. NPDC086777]|uniref:YceI family protein n=1 Tax=Streptomyces sp. NPDC086777 TaxID=3154866 RepID=UPI00344D0E28